VRASRTLWWLGAGLDLVLLLPALYMANASVDVARQTGGAPAAVLVAVLFFVLPVLCLLSVFAAWRARRLERRPAQILLLFATPWVYAGFLVAFLVYG
jgi:uncharacterized membrane protein YhaH (DUF805 family)